LVTSGGHAIIEQVHADLKNSAPAHLPSGEFNANSAWFALAVMAFNLTRAAGRLAGGRFTRATTGTIRRTLISVPARVASSARRQTPHLPTGCGRRSRPSCSPTAPAHPPWPLPDHPATTATTEA